MSTLVEGSRGRSGLREIHDRLETAYFALARTSGRWFERRTPTALMGGFAGLDSATMNRVALVDAEDERALAATLADADAFFGERHVPWSVQVTPFSRPAGIEHHLGKRGFTPALELTVMAWTRPEDAPETGPAEVRLVREDEAARFTALTVDAFRMPPRFFPALRDVNEAWLAAGARAYFAIVGGEPVGTALLARSLDVDGIYNVATLRPWRKRGIATQLMRRAFHDHLADAARRGPGADPALTLQVAKGSPAEAMYERLGFEALYAWRLYAR